MAGRPVSRALSALLSAAALTACAATPPAPATPAIVAEPPRGPDASRFHVLMINGGGNPGINFQPHLLHLVALRDLLVSSGVPPEHITVLSSDGDDPAPDLATREPQPERDFWLLTGTALERALETPRLLKSSEIPGSHLRPATKAELTRWFEAARGRLAPGDVLFVYVTDHGQRSGPDPMSNTIMLWGKDERVSVRELGALLDGLPSGVRVVSLMSQCFSGGFAGLSSRRPDVCGYFSSTADRPAYGCFPENQGRARVGHSFHFLRALAATHRMADAHASVLAEDDTPDVPVRSSDVYLEDVLRKVAGARAIPVEALAGELLGPSWRERPGEQAPRALADRIGLAFGLAGPGSLADTQDLERRLPELERRLGAASTAWKGALSDATTDNLRGFLAASPEWSARVAEPALGQLGAPEVRALTRSLLAELGPFAQRNEGARLDLLFRRVESTAAAAYRTEVRLAATLRIRTLLLGVAGRAYLAGNATPDEREGYEALRACEDLTLPGAPSAPEATPPPAPFPPLADDVKAGDEAPGWIGISFNDVRPDLRKKQGLPDGAALISAIYPGSPAKAAGLEVGDIVLGPPGRPFTAHNQIRAWSMLSPIGEPGTVEILRGADHLELHLTPIARPVLLPTLPPPASVALGAHTPTLDVQAYRGPKPSLADGKAHLLFFWATWCVPCKAALPEVLAFERAGHAQIIAITDEDPAVLDTFFKKWTQPFPRSIAVDDLRRSFAAFGASGTPTFVLIDGKGTVRSHTVGYVPGKGIGIPGWTWSGPR